ncbi:MAG: NAD-dependent epimerase/dehydratase family protein [Bacteroidales bacterium]
MDLLTGGTGFLGAHLLYRLVEKGIKVRCIVRAESSRSQLNRIFSFYSTSPDNYSDQIEWFEADLTDPVSLYEALEGVENVYHAAAKVSFLPSDRKEMNQVNVLGTANLVNAALDRKVRKLCHVSSIAAIGRGEANQVIDENVLWVTSRRNSSYAVSKYGAEREVWRGFEEGLEGVIVNPSIILGPGEISSGSARMLETVKKGLKFYTPGINGFVDVRDVADIIVKLMESDISHERFVVSAGNISYKDLFSWIADEMGKPAPAIASPRWLSELAWRWFAVNSFLTGSKPLITRETVTTSHNNYYYSSDKIVNRLGYKFTPIRKTIADTVNFYRRTNSLE